MKKHIVHLAFLTMLMGFSTTGQAQTNAINLSTIYGGGGTSTGGV